MITSLIFYTNHIKHFMQKNLYHYRKVGMQVNLIITVIILQTRLNLVLM